MEKIYSVLPSPQAAVGECKSPNGCFNPPDKMIKVTMGGVPCRLLNSDLPKHDLSTSEFRCLLRLAFPDDFVEKGDTEMDGKGMDDTKTDFEMDLYKEIAVLQTRVEYLEEWRKRVIQFILAVATIAITVVFGWIFKGK